MISTPAFARWLRRLSPSWRSSALSRPRSPVPAGFSAGAGFCFTGGWAQGWFLPARDSPLSPRIRLGPPDSARLSGFGSAPGSALRARLGPSARSLRLGPPACRAPRLGPRFDPLDSACPSVRPLRLGSAVDLTSACPSDRPRKGDVLRRCSKSTLSIPVFSRSVSAYLRTSRARFFDTHLTWAFPKGKKPLPSRWRVVRAKTRSTRYQSMFFGNRGGGIDARGRRLARSRCPARGQATARAVPGQDRLRPRRRATRPSRRS